MSDFKQITFNLPVGIINQMTDLVSKKIEPSKNAIVRKALEGYLEALRMRELQFMEAAANDPLFMDDLSSSIKDFEAIDKKLRSKP